MDKLDLQVGDRATYRYKCEKNTEQRRIAVSMDEIFWLKNTDKEILKIERIGSNGWYTVYEKKDLLTDEERAFFKYYTKYLKLQEKEEMIRVRKESSEIWFSVNDSYRKYLYQKYL